MNRRMVFVAWAILAWVTPAAIAGALGWKGIWGSSGAFADYLIPFPVAGGVLHLPSFIVVSLVLATQPWAGRLGGCVRGLLLAGAGVGIATLLDLNKLQLAATTDMLGGRFWQEQPIGLFILTDCVIAQLFVGVFGGRSPQGSKEWLVSLIAVLVIPAAYTMASLKADPRMGLLTFSINVTLDGCVDHQEGIADDETHAFFTRLMDEGGAMLWGRVTYEMMESYWPAVARGDVEAPPAMREWAVKLEAKPKYVVSSTRKDFPWTNSHHIAGDLRTGVQKLKDATPAGVLLGSGKLATELDRLDLIDEYKFLVHPRIAGHGPTLYQSGLPSTRRLELISAKPLRNGAVAMHYRRAR
jgi:dihydrofolate reductase